MSKMSKPTYPLIQQFHFQEYILKKFSHNISHSIVCSIKRLKTTTNV